MGLEEDADKLYNGTKNFFKGIGKKIEQGKKARDNIRYVKDTINTVADKITEAYDTINDKITTNGKYDSNKVKILLEDGAEFTKKYGKKAYQTLKDLSDNLNDTTNPDLIPSEEDLLGKYAGIGKEYTGRLLKPDYEKCLTFISKADELIPKDQSYRSTILEDIKLSASGNYSDLKEFYSEKKIVDANRKNIMDTYLK